MKKINYTFILLLLALITLNAHAQFSYEARMTNFTQVSEMEFQFDIQIRNNAVDPGANTFAYNDSQFQIDINTSLLNGGQFFSTLLTVNNTGSDLVINQQLTNGMFFYSEPNTALATNSPATNNGDLVTIFNDNSWKTVTRFSVQIMDAAGSNYNNFADVNPEFAFRLDDCIVYACEYTFNAFPPPGSYTRSGNAFLLTNKTLTMEVDPDQELAGYFFSFNGDWNINSSWNNQLLTGHPNKNQPPSASNNALIAASAIIPGSLDVSVKNIYLETSGTITVQSDGSLIHNNTGVEATIERYVAAANWGVEGDGWHLLSSPVALQTIEGDWTPSGSGNNFDFYGFSEPEQAWINFKNTTEPPTWAVFNGPDFIPGRGYLVAYEQAGTKTFAGPVNVENVANIPITLSGIPGDNNHYGWNLVGNPFASALTWTGSVAGNNLGGVAKVWDETTMAYVDITAGSAIPSANGFFVSATEATGIVSLHSFNRVHSSQNWYKSNDERILLVAGDQQGNSAQQSVIRFNDEATPGYDANFDAYFMAGYAPMFYSVAEEKRFSTNTLPEMSSGMSIPFGFHKNSHADFFIEMQESIDDVIIYLTDLKEDVTQNLSEEPVYYFSASADDDPDRFVISFATVSVPEVLKKGLLQAYTYGDMLYVLNPSANAIVELYGVQGQLIMSREIGQGIHSIPVTVPGGTYIVKMVNADETATRKVVIN